MQRLAPLALAATLLLAAASHAQLIRTSQDYQVVAVMERNGYLDTVIKKGDRELRFFVAPTEDCAFLMKVENVVTWTASGVFGEFKGGDKRRCDPVGVGSLRYWRDRQPRAGDPQIAPRGRSQFEVIWQDEEYAMALGRFPYANRIGFAGGEHAIALVPLTEACRPILASGNASLEFRRSGREPYRLVTGSGLCPIDAFIRPLPQHRAREAGDGA